MILRIEFEGQGGFLAYVYRDRAKLERLLEMTGLPYVLDRDAPSDFTEVADFQLRDLLEYSDGPHLCDPQACECARHQAA